MCTICEKEGRRELTFRNEELEIDLVVCVYCINHNDDLGGLPKGYCERCKTFNDRELMHYEEEEGEYYCEDCYHEYHNEPDEQEEARELYYTHSNLGIK